MNKLTLLSTLAIAALSASLVLAQGVAPVLKSKSGGLGTSTGDISGLTSTATGATAARSEAARAADVATPFDFGAYGDLQQSTPVVTATAGNCAISVAGGSFSAADVGKIFDASGLGATYAYGGVASIAVATPGTGYTAPPMVNVSGGSGAAFQAVMKVLSATVATGGTGYAAGAQTLTVAGSLPGHPLIANVTASAGGVITAVNSLTTGGEYPNVPGTAGVATTNSGATGTGATLNLTWGVAFINVISPGVNYPTSGATATLSGGAGSGALASASTDGNTIIVANVSAGGSGYTSAPTATLVGGSGTGATITGVTVSGGAVTGVTASGGTGYANPPAIQFAPAAPASPATLGALAITPAVDPLSATIASVQSASAITLSSCPLSASSGAQSIAWGHDDTVAVQAAVNSGKQTFINGFFLVTQPIWAINTVIRGQGVWQAAIVGSVAMPQSDPILILGRTMGLADLNVQYDGPAITDRETQGQRVALGSGYTNSAGAIYELQRGSNIHGIELAHVGTGVYDFGDWSIFSTTFDAFEIQDFSYRGFDLASTQRTGNIYHNLYINTQRLNADRGFSLSGAESESTIDQLNVEHSVLNTAVYIGQVQALSAGTIHLEGDMQRYGGTGFIKFEDTSGNLDALSFYNTRLAQAYPLALEIGNSTVAAYNNSNWNTNRLHIGVVNAEGVNLPYSAIYTTYAGTGITGVSAFQLIGRTPTATGNYTLAVDALKWLSYISTDEALYASPITNAAGQIAYERFATSSSTVTGSAAYSLQAPDNTTAGGNARGLYATDLQRQRALAASVASGVASTIVGGGNNTASGWYSVSGGQWSAAAGGNTTAFGGGNQLYGAYSSAPGGFNVTDHTLYGKFVFGSGQIAALGDAQLGEHVLRGAATGTAAVRLTADGATAGTTLDCVNPMNGSAFNLHVQLIARDTTTPANSYAWTMPVAVLLQGASAAATTLSLGTPAVLTTGATTGAAVSATADTTNGCLNLSFTPPTGNSDTWHVVARVGTAEVQ